MSAGADRFEIYEDRLTRETVYSMRHPTGVRIAVCPKPHLKTVYGLFGVKYGAFDNDFSVNGGEYCRVPDGIAHYLEHKLFEDETCGAYERFARTGASANAYTSSEKTCYFFSSTQRHAESLEILLDFVQKPYFTEENVQKERGIIEQEILMHRDNPGWLLSDGFKRAMYRDHPFLEEVGGSVESISQITPELLYKCYNTFYNPGNMIISVAGNIDPVEVLEVCDRTLLPRERLNVVSRIPEDDGRVVSHFVEREADVEIPLFQLGFKVRSRDLTDREQVIGSLVCTSVFGPLTDFYSRMEEKELFTGSFSSGLVDLRGVQYTSFTGRSEAPETLREEIFEEIERTKRDGISPEIFECARRRMYGVMISSFDQSEEMGDMLADDMLFGGSCFDGLRAAAEVTVDEVNAAFREQFDITNSTLSVVRRRKEA